MPKGSDEEEDDDEEGQGKAGDDDAGHDADAGLDADARRMLGREREGRDDFYLFGSQYK